MIEALTLLLAFQLAGELITGISGLPLPGPVLGMAMLFIALLIKGGPSESLKTTSNSILQNLSLLFIPAGTGVLLHLNRLADDWLPLLLSVVLSTGLAMAVTALVIKALHKPQKSTAHQESPHA